MRCHHGARGRIQHSLQRSTVAQIGQLSSPSVHINFSACLSHPGRHQTSLGSVRRTHQPAERLLDSCTRSLERCPRLQAYKDFTEPSQSAQPRTQVLYSSSCAGLHWPDHSPFTTASLAVTCCDLSLRAPPRRTLKTRHSRSPMRAAALAGGARRHPPCGNRLAMQRQHRRSRGRRRSSSCNGSSCSSRMPKLSAISPSRCGDSHQAPTLSLPRDGSPHEVASMGMRARKPSPSTRCRRNGRRLGSNLQHQLSSSGLVPRLAANSSRWPASNSGFLLLSVAQRSSDLQLGSSSSGSSRRRSSGGLQHHRQRRHGWRDCRSLLGSSHCRHPPAGSAWCRSSCLACRMGP